MEENLINLNRHKKENEKKTNFIYASPNRIEYMIDIPKKSNFKGSFLIKNKVIKLKQMCDLAFGMVLATRFGVSIFYSDFSYEKTSHSKDGFVGIYFDNHVGIVGLSTSETAWKMFQELCLCADQIRIVRKDFESTHMYFYIKDVWVDSVTGMNMNASDLITRADYPDFWESITKNDFESHAAIKRTKKALEETSDSDEFAYYYYHNIAPYVDNQEIPNEYIDKSIYYAVKSEQSIVRDAIISLMLQHGIGNRLYLENVTPENSNRLSSFSYALRFQNSALFDSEEKLELFKRCVVHSESFFINPSDDSGSITIAFDVKNNHIEM